MPVPDERNEATGGAVDPEKGGPPPTVVYLHPGEMVLTPEATERLWRQARGD